MAQNIDAAHALYNAMLHPWFAVAGISEISVRLPSLLSTMAAAAGLYLIVRRLSSPQLALAAGLVFAVLPRTTWVAMEGRSYAFTTALAVLWTYVFIRVWERASIPLLLAYAGVSTLAIATHIFLVLMLAAHGVALLLDPAKRFSGAFWRWLLASVGGLALASPILLAALRQSSQIGSIRLSPLDLARSVLVNQWFLGGTPTVAVSLGKVLDDGGLTAWKVASVVLAGLCLILMLLGVVHGRRTLLARHQPRPDALVIGLCWLAVPTLLAAGAALLGSPIYNPRYLAYTLPGAAIAIGYGLFALRGRGLRIAAVAVALLLIAPIYLSQRTPNAKSGADWRQLTDFVAAHRSGTQGVYFAARDSGEDTDERTSRTAAVLYPQAFAGLTDLTLVRTPTENATLYATNRTLQQAAPEFATMTGVIAIYRRDAPEETVREDAELFGRAGLRPAESWQGPLNRTIVYRR